MVRATIIVSALFVLAAAVSAVPASVVDINTKKHIGTGKINLDNLGKGAVDANNIHVQDAVQDVDALDGGHDHGHNHGLLGGLLKRDENPVRVSLQPGNKGGKKNAHRMGAKGKSQKM